ncbi:MAG TPA: hypothetical protein VFN23_08120 [Ktedonobacteraceae bacterium]|nr:hypothetical protein [Ktedonobacteraceae bacterium]
MIYHLLDQRSQKPLLSRFVNIFLLVGLLIATFFSLTRPSLVAKASSLPLVEHAESMGIEMSIYMEPGPYFRNELVAVDLTLTNHSDTTWYVGSPFGSFTCGSGNVFIPRTNIQTQLPPDPIFGIDTIHCNPGAEGHAALLPGQTLFAHKFQYLSYSGQITERPDIGLYKTVRESLLPSSPSFYISYVLVPTNWPAIQMNIAPTTPTNRLIPFSTTAKQVLINAPANIRSQLQYHYRLVCLLPDQNDRTYTLTNGNNGWETLKTTNLSRPYCASEHGVWFVEFGAPGYAVTSKYIFFSEAHKP